jgi:DNA modification methylase
LTSWKEKRVIGNATLYLGDCREVLHGLRDGCQNGDVSVEQGRGAGNDLKTRILFDAVITSPPYAKQRDYGQPIEDWDALMRGAFSNLPASDGCQILINMGQIHRDGEVICYWESWRDWMRSQGWRLFGQYIWDKLEGLPGDWNGRFAPAHEYILHFNKVAVQLAKVLTCKSAGIKNYGTGLRKVDGTTGKYSHHGRPVQEFKILDSVIRTYAHKANDDARLGHPATFPIALVEPLISSFPGTVLDPFMGSGTTGVACMNLGRQFIGIEIEPKYYEIACERIENAQRQTRLFA